MSSFKDVIEGQRAAIALSLGKTVAPIPPAKTAEELMGIALKPGTRVLDKLTGQEGTVNAGTVRNFILPTSQK